MTLCVNCGMFGKAEQRPKLDCVISTIYRFLEDGVKAVMSFSVYKGDNDPPR